jgi:hypothetical protein
MSLRATPSEASAAQIGALVAPSEAMAVRVHVRCILERRLHRCAGPTDIVIRHRMAVD